MSIAKSVIVRPSRLLLAMTAAMSACVMLVGILLGLGVATDLVLWVRVVATACCTVMALAGVHDRLRICNAWRVDISSDGQIRLTQLPAAEDSSWTGDVVRLMPDSTLWANLLLLRLRTDDGKRMMLPIFPDSVPDGEFRALSVACRWVAAHNNPAENDNV